MELGDASADNLELVFWDTKPHVKCVDCPAYNSLARYRHEICERPKQGLYAHLLVASSGEKCEPMTNGFLLLRPGRAI